MINFSTTIMFSQSRCKTEHQCDCSFTFAHLRIFLYLPISSKTSRAVHWAPPCLPSVASHLIRCIFLHFSTSGAEVLPPSDHCEQQSDGPLTRSVRRYQEHRRMLWPMSTQLDLPKKLNPLNLEFRLRNPKKSFGWKPSHSTPGMALELAFCKFFFPLRFALPAPRSFSLSFNPHNSSRSWCNLESVFTNWHQISDFIYRKWHICDFRK